MSRGVRDLRELVCVSRLTYRDSDDEDTVLTDEDELSQNLNNLELSDGSSSPGSRSGSAETHPACLQSPDSGFVTNGSPEDKAEGTVKQGAQASIKKPLPSDVGIKSKPSKRRRKKKAQQHALLPHHDLPKLPVLPPVPVESTFLTNSSSLSSRRANSSHGISLQKRGDFDSMLIYMDATIVAEWLTRANTALEDLTTYCTQGDHFVQFAHFWLSNFPETQRQEIYEMEHEILIEEIGLAFAVGKESRKIVRRDVTDLLSALFREYPTKLFSSKGAHLFLDHLDILTSDRTERYKKLLADVRCSTKNRQYAQWLLATRSFALVSVWAAVVNFYRNLLGQHGVPPGLPIPAHGSAQDSVYQRRMSQAVRLGFKDVVHYLVSGGYVDATRHDIHGRSLLFSAVMHNQVDVVHYLVTRVHSALDVNQPSDTGNTPLHAASNSGNADIVKVLVHSPDININCCNPQCENATPLHLAVMHGHKKVVEALLAAGADPMLKMGDLTAVDIARDFNRQDLLSLL
ncbi:uncharacterized protein LOC143284211 [Babylonia areolata]|uniref:uncharacterized protein LOC143284211 n=1 Tax=Babylonia areolata TaxID=304850 RepID=UPI003FCF0D5C